MDPIEGKGRNCVIYQLYHHDSCSYSMFCLFSVTDSLHLCGTLKHLDECKYNIPPLEKRDDLHNMESKTVPL